MPSYSYYLKLDVHVSKFLIGSATLIDSKNNVGKNGRDIRRIFCHVKNDRHVSEVAFSAALQFDIPVSLTAVDFTAAQNAASLRSECRFSTMKLFRLAQRPGDGASANS